MFEKTHRNKHRWILGIFTHPMDPGDVLDLFCDFFVGDPNLFSLRSKNYIVKHNKTSSLVGGFNPSEKY